MRHRHVPHLPQPVVEDSPFIRPAHRYLACPGRHGRDLALETVTEALRLADATLPRVTGVTLGSAGRAVPATRLHLSDGSTVTHHVWHKSFDGLVIEVRIAGGLHGDCLLEIMTGLGQDGDADDVAADHECEDLALACALRALRCARLHLDLSMSYPTTNTEEQEAATVVETETAAALASEPHEDDLAFVRHATPWGPVRVIDSEPHADLLDEEGLAALGERDPVLFVSATGDGSEARIEWVGRFVDVPDPVLRLRTLAAATSRRAA